VSINIKRINHKLIYPCRGVNDVILGDVNESPSSVKNVGMVCLFIIFSDNLDFNGSDIDHLYRDA